MKNDWRARNHPAYWAFVVHRASGLLLAAHMTGGLRLLALEFLAWRDWQLSLLAAAAGVSIVAGLAFLLNVV